ncbi:Hypothetical_protein [Hexamita inflata]|uniref:Hypothetical_protein n=1 Tax=Hexamita inflata TaxID=28002 RepID=A0AA86PY26_9EUKA|nr:Hypothetical protein HINF_LOCUS35023 [Hexamita inflata]
MNPRHLQNCTCKICVNFKQSAQRSQLTKSQLILTKYNKTPAEPLFNQFVSQNPSFSQNQSFNGQNQQFKGQNQSLGQNAQNKSFVAQNKTNEAKTNPFSVFNAKIDAILMKMDVQAERTTNIDLKLQMIVEKFERSQENKVQRDFQERRGNVDLQQLKKQLESFM